MLFAQSPPVANELLTTVRKAYRTEQEAFAEARRRQAEASPDMQRRIQTRAATWMERVRVSGSGASDLDGFMDAFALSRVEAAGVTCLAEALLQIPDVETVECLLNDILSDHDRERNSDGSEALFVNAPAWALLFSGGGRGELGPVDDDWPGILRAWL